MKKRLIMWLYDKINSLYIEHVLKPHMEEVLGCTCEFELDEEIQILTRTENFITSETIH